MGYKTTMEQARDASDELVWQDTPEGRKPQMVRTAEKALEAEREKERQENALYHIQTLSEKTIKKLDEEISAKNMTLECTDALIAIRKNDMVEWEEKTDLFDKVVDITYENEQLRNKIQVLQDKLEKAYEFMK